MAEASTTTDVVALYDGSADWYAKTMDEEIDLPVYHEVLSGLARSIASISGPVLDTSCGSGHMLQRYRERYDSERPLLGVDLSPSMVALTAERLGGAAEIVEGDMRELPHVQSGTVAGLVSFFALHHLSEADAAAAVLEWARVLAPGGRAILAVWEGSGPIDYGEHSELVALRYQEAQVVAWVEAAGLNVVWSRVDPVEGMGMDAVYLEASDH